MKTVEKKFHKLFGIMLRIADKTALFESNQTLQQPTTRIKNIFFDESLIK